jgi:ABC-2 type transport system permease protein
MSLTRNRWARGLVFLALLGSYVGVGALLVRDVGNRVFYEGWQRVLHARSRTRRRRTLLRPLDRAAGWVMPKDFRGLVIKDLRVFLRDPAQWTQGLIFYGILGLYFVNLRNLQYHVLSDEWRNIIAFLNVFSVAAVMCSLGARFIFPQLSLEGQGFWMVGMSPVSVGRVLAAKFVASCFALLVVSMLLMVLSVEMLRLGPAAKSAALAVGVGMSVGVAGMSTGLGAAYLDLKQRNPAVIISSFGGTLNLVLMLGFMFAAVLPFATVFHMHYHQGLSVAGLHRGLVGAYTWLLVLTAFAAGIPLLLGRRHLLQRDY